LPLLAIETSCDETSAAVVHQGTVLSNVVSSQIELHAEYGGVVPELAAREHLKQLAPVVRTALRQARLSAEQLDAVAATQGPGLPSALMVGLKSAQAAGFVLRKPFVGIHHHEAHLYSPWIQGTPAAADFSQFRPNVSLIVSGGHTLLVNVPAEFKHRVLGSTLDDAAGECFDKVGKLMGLPYPAGPEIDRRAEHGDPKAVDFPRPMLHDSNDDFSFSGLKTSVRYFLRDHPEALHDPCTVRNICASVQMAIVEVLVAKTIRAARRLNVTCVTASGGVTRNKLLRKELAAACQKSHLDLRLSSPSFCTDNAAMVGVVAERKLLSSALGSSLDCDILPSWELSEAGTRDTNCESARIIAGTIPPRMNTDSHG
jgi:N6-L-threonylcarbamoyladenine synthase